MFNSAFEWDFLIQKILDPSDNNPKNLDLSYKTDLDFLDCFESETLSCGLRNKGSYQNLITA